jgi:hypothetical protein
MSAHTKSPVLADAPEPVLVPEESSFDDDDEPLGWFVSLLIEANQREDAAGV